MLKLRLEKNSGCAASSWRKGWRAQSEVEDEGTSGVAEGLLSELKFQMFLDEYWRCSDEKMYTRRVQQFNIPLNAIVLHYEHCLKSFAWHVWFSGQSKSIVCHKPT